MANQLSSIDHVVVLMLENRSFDQMLGYLYAGAGNVSPSGQPFDGLTGQETNPDASGAPVSVYQLAAATADVYLSPGADPGEGFEATNAQLFGTTTPATGAAETNDGFVTNYASTLQWEQQEGWSIVAGTQPDQIMGMFTPDLLPVLSGLAQGFAVCDQWFASVPTETMPNRAFVQAGTSLGHMDDTTTTFDCPTIYANLTAASVSWMVYGYTSAPLTRLDFPDLTSAPDANFGLFSDFQAAAAAGTLASYSFLEPSWESTGNSQHPNYDVALGEQLIYDTYEALRSGPAWDSTLLVITYDEHGGCYDHVSPPSGAVAPDNSVGEYGFDFTRFGVRVPTVLVSPLVPSGTVFRVAEGSMPLDHTSILKTVENRWTVAALTARDAAAPDFADVLSLTVPRTDDPLAGVTVPVSGTLPPSAADPSHLQQIYADLASKLPVPAGMTEPPRSSLHTTADYTRYIDQRIEAWKAGRARYFGHA